MLVTVVVGPQDTPMEDAAGLTEVSGAAKGFRVWWSKEASDSLPWEGSERNAGPDGLWVLRVTTPTEVDEEWVKKLARTIVDTLPSARSPLIASAAHKGAKAARGQSDAPSKADYKAWLQTHYDAAVGRLSTSAPLKLLHQTQVGSGRRSERLMFTRRRVVKLIKPVERKADGSIVCEVAWLQNAVDSHSRAHITLSPGQADPKSAASLMYNFAVHSLAWLNSDAGRPFRHSDLSMWASGSRTARRAVVYGVVIGGSVGQRPAIYVGKTSSLQTRWLAKAKSSKQDHQHSIEKALLPDLRWDRSELDRSDLAMAAAVVADPQTPAAYARYMAEIQSKSSHPNPDDLPPGYDLSSASLHGNHLFILDCETTPLLLGNHFAALLDAPRESGNRKDQILNRELHWAMAFGYANPATWILNKALQDPTNPNGSSSHWRYCDICWSKGNSGSAATIALKWGRHQDHQMKALGINWSCRFSFDATEPGLQCRHIGRSMHCKVCHHHYTGRKKNHACQADRSPVPKDPAYLTISQSHKKSVQ